MAANTLGILATTLLEGKDLLVTHLAKNFRCDQRAFDQRSANGCIGTIADHHHARKFNHVASIAGELLNSEYIICGNAILLSAGFDDCEHRFLP